MKTRPQAQPYWILLVTSLLYVTSGSSAHAQTPAAPPSCDADVECNRLANEASDHSQAGRFEEAQRTYKAAYAKQPDVVLLFNLARVLHKGGQLAEAISYYQQYLDAGAEGSEDQRRKAQQRLEEARRDQAVLAAANPPQTPTPPISLLPPAGESPATTEPPRSVPVYRQWWLWTVVGVAAAGVAVGIGLGVAARRPDLTGYSEAHPFGS